MKEWCVPLAAVLGVASICPDATAQSLTRGTQEFPIQLIDVTRESGIDFVHHTGARGKRWLPETMGSGVVVFDADEDGILDLLFLDGRSWDGPRVGEGARVYRGTGDLRYEDITDRAGLPSMYGMGGAAGDLDGDGHVDVALSALDGVRVLWGSGDGRFEGDDATPVIEGWCTSLAPLDYDADGRLDLFVCRYVEWSPETDLWCSLDGVMKTYCTPEVYEPTTCVLLRGVGDRRFEDVSESAGIDRPAKALGVVCDDLDGDGAIDVFVANDTMPDLLFLNRGNEGEKTEANVRFEEVGLALGIALSARGTARAGMGTDSADFDGSGLPGLAVGHFSGETVGLFRNVGVSGFVDVSGAMGLALPTLPELTFGLMFCDLDGDGWADLVTANGHIESEISHFRPSHSYRQPVGIYRNVSGERFEPITWGVPDGLFVGRGLAYGDLDGDGDPDVVMTQNGGPPVILRNDSPQRQIREREPDAPAPPRAYSPRYRALGYLSCSARLLSLRASAPPVMEWALGRAFLENGEFDRTVEMFGKLAARPNVGLDPWIYSAVAARRAEDLVQAAAFLDEAAAMDPDSPRLRWQRGLLLNQDRRYTEAIPDLLRAVEAAPEMATAHYQLGIAFERSGKALDAEAALGRAVELEPGLFQARYALYLLLRSSDPEAARKHLAILEDQRDSIPEWRRNDLIQLERGVLSEITWPGSEDRQLPIEQRSNELLLELEPVRNVSSAGAVVECWGMDGWFVRHTCEEGVNRIGIGPWNDGLAVVRVVWPNGIVHDATLVELDFGGDGLDPKQARLKLKEQLFIKGSWGGTRVD